MDFYTWLCAQSERIDHVGIIAGIAKQDKTFPRRQRKLYIFLRHYDRNSRLSAEQRENCRRAIKIAHAEWRRAPHEPIGEPQKVEGQPTC